MKRKTNNLIKAGVLLVAVIMVSSLIPATVASDTISKDGISPFAALSQSTKLYKKSMKTHEINMEQSSSFDGDGFGVDAWLKYHDGSTEDALGLQDGGTITEAIELTDAELSGFRDHDITEIDVSIGWETSPYAVNYEVWILESLPANSQDIYTLPSEDIYATGTSSASNAWNLIDITDYAIPDTGSVFVGLNYIGTSAGQYPCGMDLDTTTPDRGGIVTYDGYGSWGFLGAIGFPGVWALSVGVTSAGPGPGPSEDCIPNACDFAIDGFTDEFMAMAKAVDIDGDGETDYYAWNSFPHEICVRIANKGEIGIGELKLMADVFKKVCGPTITIFDDPKYNLQEFPCCGAMYPIEFPEAGDWIIEDEGNTYGDHDSWCLQGGEENRWLTNNQAWRCTKGEDRSFGVDEDVYLGKSDTAPGNAHDNLTTPGFDVSGAACAEISFSHWCEGEYIIDEDGYVIPADYGVLYYSIDNGTTWTKVNDFLAYDTDGQWEEVTLKFINNATDEDDLDYMHPYNMVCDDCAPDEDDVVVSANLNSAILRLRFSWIKDPCLQYEGWYVDALKVTRTEDYELELSCQTHEILELEPCDVEVGVEWIDYCFPLPCTFEDDTWYEVHILGQVFSPYGCEEDLENNEFKFQFKIMDVHDMACVDLHPTGETTTAPGESVPFNVTVRNEGTFAEDKVPVSLQFGKLIKNAIVDDNFETDSLGDYSVYYFLFDECNSVPLWRWSKGDATLDKIFGADQCQARSRNPGDECLVFAEEGAYYPYMIEDSMSVLAFPEVLDLDPNKNWEESGEKADSYDPIGAQLSFDMKYSLDIDGGSALGSYAMLGLMPNEGPASGYVLFIDNLIDLSGVGTYSNDWVHFEEEDLAGLLWNRIKQWNADPEEDDYDYIPNSELGILCWGEGDCVDIFTATSGDGGCINPDNPLPWTGFMFDELSLDVIEVDDLEEFAQVTTGALKPGDEETFNVAWTSELCAHAITAETQLPGDINPANDRCCSFLTFTSEEERCFEHYIEDMTGGGDCLWHACTNRENGDDYFAWAGVETEHSAQYVNNMDDSLVSPTIDLSDFKDEGVVLYFDTWYQFGDGDFGEVDLYRTFDHDGDDETENVTRWDQIGNKLEGSTMGGFEHVEIFLSEGLIPEHPTKIRFRMYSDDEDVGEGWYIDDVVFYNVTDDNLTGLLAGERSYAIDAGTDEFLWFDVADPANLYTIGPYPDPDFAQGATFVEDELWFCDTEGGIYTIDEDTGTFTFVGEAGMGLSALAYHEPSGVLYGSSIDDVTYDTSLVTINMADGSASLIGSMGVDYIISIDCDVNGVMYGYCLDYTGVAANLYTIDLTDGSTTLVGASGLALNYGQDMAYDLDNEIMYACVFDYNTYVPELCEVDLTTGAFTILGVLGGDQITSFAIPYTLGGGGGGWALPDGAIVGDCIPLFTWDPTDGPCIETWERGEIAPWSCQPVDGGQFWMHWGDRTDSSSLPNGASDYFHDVCGCEEGWFVIPSENLVPYGYNPEGGPMNDAIAFELDLTDPTLDPNYIVFSCAMNYNFNKERAYIEFSPDWDPTTPMESATWIVYWCHTPGDEYDDSTGGWMTLDEILEAAGHPDDRFLIDEYSGEKVYVRFRLETDGNGAGIGEGWALDGLKLLIKHIGDGGGEETEPPITSIFFDKLTAKVTLIAQDYPLNKGSGIDATYYKIDGGETQTYGGPFTLGEGAHTVQYWSEDNAGNTEATKSSTFTVDTKAPTVTITSPLEGKLYLFGSPIMDRILSDTTLCIGKVPIAATADDGDGVGVARVLFNIDGDSGYDESAPYEYEYRRMHFGALTISAVAVDGNGLVSSPESITVQVYSLGLL